MKNEKIISSNMPITSKAMMPCWILYRKNWEKLKKGEKNEERQRPAEINTRRKF
jgi:hypothetical protein